MPGMSTTFYKPTIDKIVEPSINLDEEFVKLGIGTSDLPKRNYSFLKTSIPIPTKIDEIFSSHESLQDANSVPVQFNKWIESMINVEQPLPELEEWYIKNKRKIRMIKNELVIYKNRKDRHPMLYEKHIENDVNYLARIKYMLENA